MSEPEELEEYEEIQAYESALVFGGQDYWDGEDDPNSYNDDQLAELEQYSSDDGFGDSSGEYFYEGFDPFEDNF